MSLLPQRDSVAGQEPAACIDCASSTTTNTSDMVDAMRAARAVRGRVRLPRALKYMRSRGMAIEKFVYVPNGVDENGWAGRVRIQARDEWLSRMEHINFECLSTLPAHYHAKQRGTR